MAGWHWLRYAVLLLGLAISAPTWADKPTLMIFGDSLSAAYGIDVEQGWVSLLERRVAERGYPHQIVNASISGDTSRGGLARLPATLERHQPAIVVLELGGNDGLRGLPLKTLEDNLVAIIELCRRAGAHVILAEMRIPPNYGPRYTERFQALFTELAQRYQLPLIPFLLEGVAGNPALMQSDGIHPRAEAQPRILENVWPALEAALRSHENKAARRVPNIPLSWLPS